MNKMLKNAAVALFATLALGVAAFGATGTAYAKGQPTAGRATAGKAATGKTTTKHHRRHARKKGHQRQAARR